MGSVDPETLVRLTRRVAIVARHLPRADEVTSLASVAVAAFYVDNVDMAAAAAVKYAARTVDTAYAGIDSLDRWAEVAPDMVEACEPVTDIATGTPHAWKPRPDAAYATTDADVIRAAIDSIPDADGRRILRDAAAAYVAHGERRCHVCASARAEARLGGQDGPVKVRVARRVALAGILAHTRRLTGSDADFHALRRQTLAALRSIDVAAVRAEHYYPYAEGGRAASVHLEYPDVLTGDPAVTERVTVRQADGTAYATTHTRVTGAAPERTEEDRRADRIAETIAGAPSRAVRKPQRKRSAGTGAYGSQVGARLSRGTA